MKIHRFGFFVLSFGFTLFSCTTTPSSTEWYEPSGFTLPESGEAQAAGNRNMDVSKDSYVVSSAMYNQTFDEIETLNTVISERRYDRWLTYLSDRYKALFNAPETLKKTNNTPRLKNQHVVLKSIRDYFNWVVVPSRSSAVLDEIVFRDENHVAVYSIFEGKRAKLYELEKIKGKWKISVW